MPATLHTTSRRPCSATTASIRAWTSVGLLTSVLCRDAAGVSMVDRSVTSAAATVAPSAASRSTVAFPMPDAAPVTRTTLPSKRESPAHEAFPRSQSMTACEPASISVHACQPSCIRARPASSAERSSSPSRAGA